MKKLNEIQKIILIIYVMTLSSMCLFYVPFKSGYYDTIWSDNGNIDISKLIILVFVQTVILFISVKFSESFNKYDEEKRKVIIKKELKIFLVFISIILCFLLYFYVNNGLNYLKESKLINQININRTEIANSYIKKNTRREFWDSASYNYDMTEFKQNIGNLWDFMSKNKDNENWLKYYLSNFNQDEIIKFKIKNPKEFKIFIEMNTLNKEDINKEMNNIYLESEIIDLQREIKKIHYYSSDSIRIYMVYVLIFSLLFLYILRIFLNKVIHILKS